MPADPKLIDYYNRFLLDPNTAVYSRKNALPSDSTVIVLEMGKYSLSFEKLEDGSAMLITWNTPERRKQFRVRSQMSFMNLRSYGENYLKRQAQTQV